MPLLLRNIRSKKRKILLTELESITRKEFEKALDSKIKPLLVKSHELVTANWEHKPDFKTRKEIRPDKISITVFPTGENADIYKFVDKGTKPHVIIPKVAKRLRFITGYQPKTLAKPARTVPSGGKALGEVVFAKKVNHPGTEAREFTQTIANDIKPDFIRAIENTFRSISRKLEE